MSVIKTPKKVSTVNNTKIVPINNILFKSAPPLVDAEVVVVAEGDRYVQEIRCC